MILNLSACAVDDVTDFVGNHELKILYSKHLVYHFIIRLAFVEGYKINESKPNLVPFCYKYYPTNSVYLDIYKKQLI